MYACSVYDEIPELSYYEELSQLNKNTHETFDLPDDVSEDTEPGSHERQKPAEHDDQSDSDDEYRYADLDKKTHRTNDPPTPVLGHAVPNPYQQVRVAAAGVKPVSTDDNPVYLHLIDDPLNDTCRLWYVHTHSTQRITAMIGLSLALSLPINIGVEDGGRGRHAGFENIFENIKISKISYIFDIFDIFKILPLYNFK